jgi:hypothetical protein
VVLGGKWMPARLPGAAAAGAAGWGLGGAAAASGEGGTAAAAMGCPMAPSVPALSTVATICPGMTVSCSFTRIPISLPSLGALMSMVTLSVSTCRVRHGAVACGEYDFSAPQTDSASQDFTDSLLSVVNCRLGVVANLLKVGSCWPHDC